MKRIILKSKFLLTLLILIIVLPANSCVDLTAIRKFAESSTVVAQKFPALSSDFYRACSQRSKYFYYDYVNYDPLKMREIDSLAGIDKIEAFKGTIPADQFGNTPVKDEILCREWKKIHPMATNLNKVLVDYMKALGDLAADELTSYDKDFDQLNKSIVKTKFFKESEVTAGTMLAKFLSNIFTEAFRRKKLKEAIETQNGNVKILTSALGKYVTDNYITALKDEQRALNVFYGDAIIANRNRDSAISTFLDRNKATSDPLAVISIKQMWDAELAKLQDRINAAEAYGKIMDNFREGHQKLYDSRNNLNSKDVQKMALSYANTIEELIETFRKGF